jgi:hypothetical protein
MIDLQYSPHHIGHHSSVKLLHARPLVLLLPRGGNIGQKQQDTRSSDFNKTRTYVNRTQSFTICNGNLHTSQTIFTTCVRQYIAKEELTESGRSKEKCELRKLNLNNLQPAVDLEVNPQKGY